MLQMAKVSNQTAVDVPTYRSVQSMLYRYRTKKMPPVPTDRNSFIIPDNMRVSVDGERFLLTDDMVNSRMLIFATDDNLQKLAKAKNIFADGTFSVVPTIFYQLYTIHGVVSSPDGNDITVPLIYAVLSDNSEKTYIHMLKCILARIKEMGFEWTSKSVSLDFEKAAINAFQHVLPHIDVCGCNFHFNQALWKRVQALGLVRDYKRRGSEVKRHIQRLAALSYVPLELLDTAWIEVMAASPDSKFAKICDYNDYFVDTWIDQDRAVWNCSTRDVMTRTNNPVESWHRHFNSIVDQTHPHIWKLINSIREEDKFQQLAMERNNLNVGEVRRVHVSDRQQLITEALDQLNKDNNIMVFLDVLGAGALTVHEMVGLKRKQPDPIPTTTV